MNDIFNLNLSDSDICFKTLMSCSNDDCELAPVVCDFVNTCFDLRKHYFEPFQNDKIESNEPTYTRSGRLCRPRDRLIETIGLSTLPPDGSL